MNRHEALTLTAICLLALAVGVAFTPSRTGLRVSTVEQYSTQSNIEHYSTTVTVTELVTSSPQSMITFGYTAAYALLGPSIGPLSGYLPPNQTGCIHLYATDHNTYQLYNLPAVYPTGQVALYGQYLTWEPVPQDSCSGIRIYVTSISER